VCSQRGSPSLSFHVSPFCAQQRGEFRALFVVFWLCFVLLHLALPSVSVGDWPCLAVGWHTPIAPLGPRAGTQDLRHRPLCVCETEFLCRLWSSLSHKSKYGETKTDKGLWSLFLLYSALVHGLYHGRINARLPGGLQRKWVLEVRNLGDGIKVLSSKADILLMQVSSGRCRHGSSPQRPERRPSREQ